MAIITLSEVQVTQFVGQYIWPLTRISAFLLAAPIFGTQIVSSRIRLALSFAVTILVAPLLPPLPAFSGFSLPIILISMQQVIIGLTLAFAMQVVFQLFVLSGQYIAMKMGLGFASMNDPSSGVTVTIISQFYLLTTTLLFVSINGHLLLIDVLVKSFTVMPVGMDGFSLQKFSDITLLGSWMFSGALTIALPVMTALLLVNVAFGIMSRSAPQMNIFAVGFPITLVLGLVLMWMGFSSFLSNFYVFTDKGFIFLEHLLGAG